ncbi:receptor-like protein EIX2 [Dioscorea cayenensis subsp. rotundata]|uniref:Receptor-like protein EIX2 n=1 Tax=Dioscorea cayennensis subsp. rotundata TaxID=55577 RepID=A0AB40CAU1_DIOCR|nr:receptor-like protein EIX2 [Dioscorea cayenensis subsp. rotundata]
MACLLQFVLFAIFVVSALIPPPCYVHGIISCIETERIALLSIKAGIVQSNNQSLFFSSWTGQDCCKWKGVGCNNESWHVIKLDLQRYLSHISDHSHLPPSKLNSSLIQLHHLKYLDLSMNNFNDSPIPDFIGSLTNLEYLNLSFTGFSGIIPHTFGNLSRLRYLDLSSHIELYFPQENKFQWLWLSGTGMSSNDLHWLSGMSSLSHLDLSGVDLSNVHGWFHDINTLPSLLVLKLTHSKLLVGGIHDTALLHYLNFTSLRVLDLSQNYHLNITLPQWLFHLTSLVHLDLNGCALYGKLPVTISNLSSLRILSLFDNNFDGVIPESLVYFGLSNNKIGKLPKNIGRLQKLEMFDLSGNQLQGLMPASWRSKKPEILDFDGANNNFWGKLPETIGNLVHFQFLELSQNAISGKLPESFGNLSQ